MEKMKRLNRKKLHNSEHLEVTKFMLDWAKAANIEKFKTLLTPLEAAYDAEFKTMHAPKAVKMTKRLMALKEMRNVRLKRLTASLKAKMWDKDYETANHAKALLAIVKRYPTAKSANLTKSIGDVLRLVSELQHVKYTNSVTTVGVSNDIKDLEDANKTLEKEFKQHIEAENVNTAETQNARKQTDELLNRLTELAQAMSVLEATTAGLDTFIAENNSMVDKMREIISKRDAANKQKRKQQKAKDLKMIAPHLDVLSAKQGRAKGSYTFVGANGKSKTRVYKLQENDTSRIAFATFNKHGELEIKKVVEGETKESKRVKNQSDDGSSSAGKDGHGGFELKPKNETHEG